MLLSQKITKAIESEIKSLKATVKTFEKLENDYGYDYAEKKNEINKSIAYAEKVLKESK